MLIRPFIVTVALAGLCHDALPQSRTCQAALADHSVCEAANTFIIHLMAERRLEATSIVLDVHTGALVAFASSHPRDLDVSTSILPLSFAKVLLAASWWDHRLPNEMFESHGLPDDPAFRKKVDPHNILVDGSDAAGREMAIALRKAIGSEAVIKDLDRYGFNSSSGDFWAYVDPVWQLRLTPAATSISLSGLSDQEWSAALSVGETHMTTTPLEISRFLQAVGNDGLQCAPIAKLDAKKGRAPSCGNPERILQQETATQIQDAMLDTVKRGTAVRIADSMAGTKWAIGGKTGTGGRHGYPLDQQDGCFAGLIFDPSGKARFTVVTFVRSGGIGGGNAAEISAAIARFLASVISSKEDSHSQHSR